MHKLGKACASVLSGSALAAAGTADTFVSYCADNDKYFDPEALERGAKVRRQAPSPVVVVLLIRGVRTVDGEDGSTCDVKWRIVINNVEMMEIGCHYVLSPVVETCSSPS